MKFARNRTPFSIFCCPAANTRRLLIRGQDHDPVPTCGTACGTWYENPPFRPPS
jgi:hypothetical protein